jgi:hypothetical protein
MIRIAVAVVFVAVSSISAQPNQTRTEVWTGWFSDKQCARINADEAPRPNGTACVKKCLDSGSPAVFISEQARKIYVVRDHAAVKSDVGYYVEITGVVNEEANTVSIKSVKRLSEVTAMCLRPKKLKK